MKKPPSPKKKVKARRTQQERREGTIRKLLDASIDTLIDEGYAGASVQRICARAEVSQGGLFRHFATREALLVAAAEDVGERLLHGFQESFEAKVEAQDPLDLALRLLRDSCRSRLNQAWYELATAARTSPALRKALRPIAKRYYEKIEALARLLLPDLADAMPGPAFASIVGTVIATFDGEAIHRFVLEDLELEDRFAVMSRFARTLTAMAASTR